MNPSPAKLPAGICWIAPLIMAALMWGHACPGAIAAEPITYRLKWLFNASVAGDLFADVHQYFAAQGLAVTIKAGGPERDAIRELELNRAQFGVASADQVIRAIAKGADVVVIAQLFQVNPLQWIYRTDKLQITDLTDLKGHTLGVTFGGNDETILRALLKKGALTDKDVRLFSVRYDYTPFLRKKVHFWPVYRNTQAVFLGAKLRRAGEPYTFFNPVDYGVNFVANSVITTRSLFEERTDLVEKFSRALLRGWRHAMDPHRLAQTVQTLRRFDRDTPADTLRQQITVTRGLIHPKPEIPIGTIDTAAWKQTEQIMLNQQLIVEPVRVQRVLKGVPVN